jgi:hypothetical protein
MQNYTLINLANSSPNNIIRRLGNQSSEIFREFNVADYRNLVDIFHRLRYDASLNGDHADDLSEFIDGGIVEIARRYDRGEEIHPGTLNVLIMAIQAHNQVSEHPYRFGVEFIDGITPPTEEFMEGIVQPITRNLQLFALHHAPWVNPVHVAREAARRAAEEAPGAETRIARTLAEFRAMGGDQMDSNCPLCMEEFVEQPVKRRSPVFMPVVFHKDAKGKWFHPMHTVCVYDVKKDQCPMCRAKVIWPKMMATRKTRRPNSSPTRRRSSPGRSASNRSPGRSASKRSPGRSASKRSPGRSAKRSPSIKRRSADF